MKKVPLKLPSKTFNKGYRQNNVTGDDMCSHKLVGVDVLDDPKANGENQTQTATHCANGSHEPSLLQWEKVDFARQKTDEVS